MEVEVEVEVEVEGRHRQAHGRLLLRPGLGFHVDTNVTLEMA